MTYDLEKAEQNLQKNEQQEKKYDIVKSVRQSTR